MITRFLIVVNAIGFLWEVAVAGPGMLTGGGNIERVLQEGSLYPAAVLGNGQWWRIVTGAFLHGSLLHIGVNMLSLWYLGRFIEYALGPWRMLLVYMASLVAAGLGVVYFSPPMVPTVGASGAIFGLFGALFAIGLKLGKPGMELVRANIGILVLNLIITFAVPAISWQAHVSGLIAGFVLTLVIYVPPRRVAAGRRRREHRRRIGKRLPVAEGPDNAALPVTVTLDRVFAAEGPLAKRAARFRAAPRPGADGAAGRARDSRGHAHDRRGRYGRRQIARLSRPCDSQRQEGRALDRNDRAARATRQQRHSAGARCARRAGSGDAAQRSQPLSLPAEVRTAMRADRLVALVALDAETVGVGRCERAPATVRSCRFFRAATNGNSSMPTPTTASASSASTFATVSSSRNATRRDTPIWSSSITRCSSSIWRWAAACCPPTTWRFSTKPTNASAGRPTR